MKDCADKALAVYPKSGLALVMQGVFEWTQHNPSAVIDLAYLAYEYKPAEASVVARLGSLLSYIGQISNFVGHHRKASVRLTRSSFFYSSI